LTAARLSLSIAAMATSGTKKEEAAREERLARALRENLRRRKEQARTRERTADEPPNEPPAGEKPPA
jgi:hypothetical protein